MTKTVVTTTPPADLAVELLEVKSRLSQDLDELDYSFDFWIRAATARAEAFLNRRLMPQTVELRLDEFPSDGFSLDVHPIRSVVSVKYDDSDAAEQTLSTAVYETDLDRLLGWIQPATGQSWPSTYDKLQAVRIEMQAGYANAEAIPEPIRHGIVLMVGHYLANREAVSAESLQEIPEGVASHLWPYRIKSV